ncbi:leucine-rich repeat serine/threonine-protein kinase 1-like isoform X2 [Sycon ciliatum]|uniref:leucine-rich repeat serine/threonine-protein kinase 1-like isoform X2 n=1 Tax=Sycon ciliatum TaxID=27933 RepID=UPI0031F6D1E7
MSLPTDGSSSTRARDDLTRRVHNAASSRLGTGDLKRLLSERPECVHFNDATKHNRAPIHSAIAHNQDECLEILLQHGANPNHVMSRFDHLWQPLHLAASLGNIRCIVVLLRYGADIFGKDESGYTPLEKASRNRHRACAQLLREEEIAHKSRHQTNQKRIATAMQDAASEGDLERLRLLITQYEGKWKERFPDGKTLLHRASEAGHVRTVVMLLDEHKTPGFPCERPPNKTPLHAACENGHAGVVLWLMRAFTEMLLKPTTDTNSTPLQLALVHSHSSAAITVLKESVRGKEATIRNLLLFADFEGRIPFHIAVQTRNLRLAIIIYGHKKHEDDDDDAVADIISNACGSEVLQQQLHTRRQGGFQPIHDACASGCQHLVQWLCDQGAKVNAAVGSDANAVTPLQIATRNGDAAMVNLLLSCKAVDDGGRALADAIRSNRADLVDVLLGQRLEEDTSEVHRLSDLNNKAGGSKLSHQQLTGLPLALCWAEQNVEDLHVDWLQRVADGFAKPLSDYAKQLFTRPAFHYVSTLELSGNKLASIPSQLFEMPLLRTLDCSNNKLSSLPRESPTVDASKLFKVSLKGNQLAEVPAYLFALRSLEILDVSHNLLVSLPPEMWYAPSLRQLYAGTNQLVALPVESRSKCRRLFGRSHASDSDSGGYTGTTSGQSLNRSMSPVAESGDGDDAQAPKAPVINVYSSVQKPLTNHFSASSSGFGSMDQQQRGSDNPSSASGQSSSSEPEQPPTQQRFSLSADHRMRRTIGSFTAKLLESSDEDGDDEDNDHGVAGSVSRMQSIRLLEVQHNQLMALPSELPCLAPELTKLNASHNQIKDVGFPRAFPPSLKGLDLSHNHLRCVVATHDVSPHQCCRLSRSRSAGPKTSMGIKTSEAASSPTHSQCSHRKHNSLQKLSSIVLHHNLLTNFNILFPEAEERSFLMVDSTTRQTPVHSGSGGGGASSGEAAVVRGKLTQEEAEEVSSPALSHLDLSHNMLRDVPVCLSKLASTLSMLNFSHNTEIIRLPDRLGLLTELYTLGMDGLNIVDPAPDFLAGKKVSEIITFLKGRLRNAAPYRRLKLMMVGLEERGKTTLLRTLKGNRPLNAEMQEEISRSVWVRDTEGAAAKPTGKTPSNISTVGVSLGAWQYAPPTGLFSSKVAEEITFMTWDFGGQKEYYATHQYFLSKRAVYLLLWRSTELSDGIKQLHSWLVNIQARAPDAAVIIVGTHYDRLQGSQRKWRYLDELRKEITERYGLYDGTPRSTRVGYPRIYSIHFVNALADDDSMKQLRKNIYGVASKLEVGGDPKLRGVHRGHRASVLDDKVPSSYLNLGKGIRETALRLKHCGKMPWMSGKEFREMFLDVDQGDFDDKEELAAAVNFLHDNGVMLHYDDPSLNDFYFLDPQWLCDMLAHVVTVDAVHTFVKNGILQVKNYGQIFKSNSFPNDHIGQYEKLLAKFEVALRINDDELLVPSLLPKKKSDSCLDVDMNKAALYHRYVTMPYVPSGFWARLISRILSDKDIADIKDRICRLRFTSDSPLPAELEWSYWSSGVQLQCAGSLLLLHISECGNVQVLPELSDPRTTGNSCFYVDGRAAVVDDKNRKLQYFWRDSQWVLLDCDHSVQVAVLRAQHEDAGTLCKETGHSLASLCALLMSKTISHIDTLVEDWFSGVISQSMKLVPCHQCVCEAPDSDEPEVLQLRRLRTNNGQVGIASCLFHWDELVFATRNNDGGAGAGAAAGAATGGDVHSQDKALHVMCLRHGPQLLEVMSPDVVFGDLPPCKIIAPKNLRKRDRLGAGAFGAVYRGTLRTDETPDSPAVDVAIKSLMSDTSDDELLKSKAGDLRQTDGEQQAAAAKKNAKMLDPSQIAQAYTNTRKELAIMCSLLHPHVVPFYGVCLRPLCFVLQLARGELSGVLKNYREASRMLSFSSAWASALQIASGLEYLHSIDIVYCDLKAENVLVFEHPTPLNDEQGTFRPVLRALQPGKSADWYRNDVAKQQLSAESVAVCGVRVKIADFGISRSTTYDGARGFCGTFGYMAPEILQYRGRETYTDKVDIFSYAMVLYELITLHGPMINASEAEIKRSYHYGIRPKLNRKHLQSSIMLRELMHWSWQQLPENRPSASQVITALTDPPHARLLHGFVLTDALPFTACTSRQATAGPALLRSPPPELATSHLSTLLEDDSKADSQPARNSTGTGDQADVHHRSTSDSNGTAASKSAMGPAAAAAEAAAAMRSSADRFHRQQQQQQGRWQNGEATVPAAGMDTSDSELWLCSGDNHTANVTVLTYTGHGSKWEDILTMSCCVYAIISVRDIMWLGMLDGSIMFVDAATRQPLAREWLCRDRPVLSMLHVPEYQRVYVALGNGIVIAYHDQPLFLASLPASPDVGSAGSTATLLSRHGMQRSSTKSAVGSVYSMQERLKDMKIGRGQDSSTVDRSLAGTFTDSGQDHQPTATDAAAAARTSSASVMLSDPPSSPPAQSAVGTSATSSGGGESTTTTAGSADRYSVFSTATQATLTGDVMAITATTAPQQVPSHRVELQEMARYTSRKDTIACMIAVPALHEDEDDPLLTQRSSTMPSFSRTVRNRTPTRVRSPIAKSGASATTTSHAEATGQELAASTTSSSRASASLPAGLPCTAALQGFGTGGLESSTDSTGSSSLDVTGITTTLQDDIGASTAQRGGGPATAGYANTPELLLPAASPDDDRDGGADDMQGNGHQYSTEQQQQPRRRPGGRSIEIWCGHDHGRIAVLDGLTLRQRTEVGIPLAEKRNRGHMAHLVVSNLSCSTVARVSRLQHSRRVDVRCSSSAESSPDVQKRFSCSLGDSPLLLQPPLSGVSRLRASSVENSEQLRRAATVARRRCTVVDDSMVAKRPKSRTPDSGARESSTGSEQRTQDDVTAARPDSAASQASSQDDRCDGDVPSASGRNSSTSSATHSTDGGGGGVGDDETHIQLVQTVWGSVRHSPVVFCWDVRTLSVVTKLDCSAIMKLPPRQANQAYVSSLLCHGQELYIGTRGGHILIMDLSKEVSQPPFHAYYRHHQERVNMFLPILQPCDGAVKKQALGAASRQASSSSAAAAPPAERAKSSDSAAAVDEAAPAQRQKLVASCGGGFRGYVDDESLQHVAVDHDGHVLMWETEWSRSAATAGDTVPQRAPSVSSLETAC